MNFLFTCKNNDVVTNIDVTTTLKKNIVENKDDVESSIYFDSAIDTHIIP